MHTTSDTKFRYTNSVEIFKFPRPFAQLLSTFLIADPKVLFYSYRYVSRVMTGPWWFVRPTTLPNFYTSRPWPFLLQASSPVQTTSIRSPPGLFPRFFFHRCNGWNSGFDVKRGTRASGTRIRTRSKAGKRTYHVPSPRRTSVNFFSGFFARKTFQRSGWGWDLPDVSEIYRLRRLTILGECDAYSGRLYSSTVSIG